MPLLHQISCRKRPRSSDTAVPYATEMTNVRMNSAVVSAENDEPANTNFSTFKKKKSLRQAQQGKGSSQSSPFFSQLKDESNDNIKAAEEEVTEADEAEEETKEPIKLTIPTIIISFCDKLACKMSTSAIEFISGIKTIRSTSSENAKLSEVDEGMGD